MRAGDEGKVRVGEFELAYRVWGDGTIPVLFIHGNLACKEWFEAAGPALPHDLQVIAPDWRGCGDSGKPTPDADYGNYSIASHASDMIGVLDALGVDRCHLATHSTGGIIAARMMITQPERYGAVLHLDPIPPQGMVFPEDLADGMAALRDSAQGAWAAMASAASSLFEPGTLAQGQIPVLRPDTGARAATFVRILTRARYASPGIWGGTLRAITAEAQLGELEAAMASMTHEQVVLWGDQDPIIPRNVLEVMAAKSPNCRLVVLPGVGHSANIERPDLYAGAFAAVLSGRSL